jgi:NADP-dependent 3-hydroxy acid dehydrogenase YdfG
MRSLDRAKAKAIVGIAHNQGLPFQVVQLDVDWKNSLTDAIEKIIKEKRRIDVVVDNAEYETLGNNWRVW